MNVPVFDYAPSVLLTHLYGAEERRKRRGLDSWVVSDPESFQWQCRQCMVLIRSPASATATKGNIKYQR